MTFNFTVRYLGCLKNIPLFPLIFEAFLILRSSLFRPHIIESIELIEDKVSSWKGITICSHKYGGIQFNYLGKEIGHIHGNGLVDILFTQAKKNEMMRLGKVSRHHVFPNSGWISFYIKSDEDIPQMIELLEMSKRSKLIPRT